MNIHKINKESSKLKGYATVYLDNEFVVKNIRIIEGKKGLFLAMPSYTKEGNRLDICNPLNQYMRGLLKENILMKI